MVASLLLTASGAALALLALALLKNHLPKRPNFAGRNIPTATGAVFIPIILLTLLAAAGGLISVRGQEVGYLLYSLLAAGVGLVDDLWGGGGDRGFKGHVGALVRGKVTTGALKVLALGGGALVLGVYVFGFGGAALAGAFLLAGSTNLANLFDVRPGRSLKFVGVPVLILLFLAPGGAVGAVSPVVGGAVALFYFDVRGRIMLGDAGAAVIGAALGYLVMACGPGLVWWVAGAGILALTVVAEVSSISRLIQEVSLLRWFDLWGRGSSG